MSEIRFRWWNLKPGVHHHHQLRQNCSLAPTNKAFAENVKRAHYQAIVWRSLETQDPQELDPELYGWVKNTTSKSLQPVTLPTGIQLASDSIMRLIRCGCKSGTSFSTRVRGCMTDGLG
jgi:hypothetical protein